MEEAPRRKRPAVKAPSDHAGERRCLLEKLERAMLKRALKMAMSNMESDFDFMEGEARRFLELAEDARLMLEGQPLALRLAPRSDEEATS